MSLKKSALGRCRKLLHTVAKITPQGSNLKGVALLKGGAYKKQLLRCSLAAVCCQAVVICGCLLDCRVVSARGRLADLEDRTG